MLLGLERSPAARVCPMTTYFSTSLVLCRHVGRGQHPFTPTPAPPAGTGQTADLFRTGNCSGQTEPRGFIPNASSSRRGNSEPGKQRVPTTSHRAAWPQRRPWTPGAALPPVWTPRCELPRSQIKGATYTATRPSPSSSHPQRAKDPHSRRASSESDVPTSLPARPGQNKSLCVCKT